MRRSFKKDILPKEAPHKNVREYKRKAHYKTKQKRCTDLEILLQDYKKQLGPHFDAQKLADLCAVHKNTVVRWFYGFCPHEIVWWNIAKYVSNYTGTSAELIHADIKTTITNFKAGKQ